MRKTLVPTLVLTLLVLGTVGPAWAGEPTVQEPEAPETDLVAQEEPEVDPAVEGTAAGEAALDGLCPEAVNMMNEECVGVCLQQKSFCIDACPPVGHPDHDSCIDQCADDYWQCYVDCF